MRKGTMDIELEPRAASPAGTAPEAPNDTAELGPPQADTDNGNDKIGIMSSHDLGSTAKSAISSPNEDYVPGSVKQEAEGDMEPQSHPNQEVVDEEVHFPEPDLTDETLLLKIRDLLLRRLRYVNLDSAWLMADGRTSSGSDPNDRWVRDTYGLFDSSEIPEPLHWSDFSIRRAWPRSRDVAGVGQYLIDSDGERTESKGHWPFPWMPSLQDRDIRHTSESLWLDWCCEARKNLRNKMPGTVENSSSQLRHRFKGKIVYCASNTFRKRVQAFPIPLLACSLSFEEPFRVSNREMRELIVGKSTSLLSTDFRGRYSVQYSHALHNTIHWQIRYFSPMPKYETRIPPCLFSDRQTATLQHGSGVTVLQEKRAVVSFRVLREAPELFSVLALQDEDTNSYTMPPNQRFNVNMFWKGYGVFDPNEVNPLTYYLLEICRVFKMCMDAWGETLSTIDKLVHVKLEDLDKLESVEELMFDNSFKRSKDYFVALQILRIIDEWLDEVHSTVEDMFKDPVLLQASMWADGDKSDKSFAVAIRYVNEHATAAKNRVRKKQDEINSLRDGLFNATSLRESTKAMALNQAIYVFTVVTVLFTPVSFLATFWALPFLNNPEAGSDAVPEPSAFRNSFIIMPILTYALVIGVAWFVGQRNSTRALLELLRGHWRILRRLLESAWNSLPQMPWR